MCREAGAYAPGAQPYAYVPLLPAFSLDSLAHTPGPIGDEEQARHPFVEAPVGGQLVAYHPHQSPATARRSDRTNHRKSEMVCEPVDLLENTCARLPALADRARQESERASS